MKTRHAQKPDAQAFDEIRIITVPRYKTSGLSGNEWRISGRIQLMRKGKIIHEDSMRDVQNCAYALGLVLMRAKDEGKEFYGGGEDGTCDQEGCAEKATVFYRLKQSFCNEAYKHEPINLSEETVVRQFCERHSTRGDCGFEDADSNYELLKGNPTPTELKDESPSAFGGIIDLPTNQEKK